MQRVVVIETDELKDGRWAAHISGLITTPLVYGTDELDAVNRLLGYLETTNLTSVANA